MMKDFFLIMFGFIIGATTAPLMLAIMSFREKRKDKKRCPEDTELEECKEYLPREAP